MMITSLTNAYIKELCLLKKTSYRKNKRLFLVEGEDFFLPSLKSGLAKEVIYTKDIDTLGIPLTLVSDNVLKKLSLYEESKAPIILCKYPSYDLEIGEKMIYLDGVQDPGNVGTIIRTALAFSYDHIYLSPNSASLYSSKTLSSSKGSIFNIKCYEDIDISYFVNKGVDIIATSLKNASDFKEIEVKKPFILVLGNEGNGVSQNTLKVASKVAKIKMDSMESLNVAVASGILMERYR